MVKDPTKFSEKSYNDLRAGCPVRDEISQADVPGKTF
jgi:hypothetical protein